MFKLEITANSLNDLKTKLAEMMHFVGDKEALLDSESYPQHNQLPSTNNYVPQSTPNPAPAHQPQPPSTFTPAQIPGQPQNHAQMMYATANTPQIPHQESSIPTAPAPSYTHEQIMQAGTALVDAGKMPQLVELLAQFGVQAVTGLHLGQLGAFAIELRKLGASI